MQESRKLHPQITPRNADLFGAHFSSAKIGVICGLKSFHVSGLDLPPLQILAQFGSEGQKRTLAIALKMAQAEFLAGIHGSPPVLLIDDVMGELDVKRRSGFLPLLEQARKTSGQVFMTATEENWPRELGKDLQRWDVKTGTLEKI